MYEKEQSGSIPDSHRLLSAFFRLKGFEDGWGYRKCFLTQMRQPHISQPIAMEILQNFVDKKESRCYNIMESIW